MAEMPSFDPTAALADHGDDFADDINGESYRPRGRALGHDASASKSPGLGLVGSARSKLFGVADEGKAELVHSLSNAADLVRQISSQVEGLGFEPLSAYARQATSLVDDLHHSLADRSVEDLIEDGRDLVRRQPEIAVVVAIVAGFIGARLVKVQQ